MWEGEDPLLPVSSVMAVGRLHGAVTCKPPPASSAHVQRSILIQSTLHHIIRSIHTSMLNMLTCEL